MKNNYLFTTIIFFFSIIPIPEGLLIQNNDFNTHAVIIDSHPTIILPGEKIIVEDAKMITSGVVGVEITKRATHFYFFLIFLLFLLLASIAAYPYNYFKKSNS